MLAHISANTLIWSFTFGPAIVLSAIAFGIEHARAVVRGEV